MTPVQEHTADALEASLNWKRRTHGCGEVTPQTVGQSITLNGWVAVNRDLGGLVFIEMRDRTGFFQLVADPRKNPDAHKILATLRSEDVVSVTGPVTARPAETVNDKHQTGTIEIYPETVTILSRSKTPPFPIDAPGLTDIDESVRLKYRYLDMRRPVMYKNLKLRHDVVQATRTYMNSQQFLEIETPMLIRTTPEGARDYLVPSRVQPGKAYALPQSPQIFKQILMIGGMERYYQIVKCFRDEDLRADRQPEFTQVDIEMSFVDQEAVITMVEGLVTQMFAAGGVTLKPPFNRMTWEEAMNRYGSDKPDLRFGMEFIDLTDVFKTSEFSAFREPVTAGGVVKALRVPGAASYSRKELDDLQAIAKRFGAKGLAYVLWSAEEGMKSPILKYMSEAEQKAIQEKTGAQTGDGVFFMADTFHKTCDVLGRFRLLFGERLGLMDKSQHAVLWVVDFPMFERGDDGTLKSNHHPFTTPRPEDIPLLDTDPTQAKSFGYDIVYNGVEIGGGSIRIHRPDLQAKIFDLLGFTPEQARSQFGFLVDALDYGAPPHGGIALGLDRITAMLAGVESIRDVMAFPKNNQALCLLSEAPAAPSDEQLAELHMRWQLPKPEEKKG